MVASVQEPKVPAEQVYQFLSTNGDGTGTTSAIGDYSLAAQQFYIQPPVGQVYAIHRMLVGVKDAGSFDADNYGNGITLTNGITLSARTGGPTGTELVSYTDIPILTNAGWTAYCYDADVKTWGSGPQFLAARWTFTKGGSPVMLDGEVSDCLVIELNDDFTNLLDHVFQVQGLLYDLSA